MFQLFDIHHSVHYNLFQTLEILKTELTLVLPPILSPQLVFNHQYHSYQQTMHILKFLTIINPDAIQFFHLQLLILHQFVLILFALLPQFLYLQQLILLHHNQFIQLLHYCLLNTITYLLQPIRLIFLLL
jgi:hypothetical protein